MMEAEFQMEEEQQSQHYHYRVADTRHTLQGSIKSLRLQIVLMPLQGLFNALIFIYHKIYNYRRMLELQ